MHKLIAALAIAQLTAPSRGREESAHGKYWRFLSRFRRDPPLGDTEQRIQRAVPRHSDALDAVFLALMRFNAFLNDCIVPEELKEKVFRRIVECR